MKLCADIGGSFVDIGIVDDAGTIHARHAHPTPRHDWDSFVALFRTALNAHGASLTPESPLCLAVAGLVDPDTGAMTSANVPSINTRPLSRDLGAAIGRPVSVINDADAFALAEAKLGAGRGHDRVFAIILGTGVGGGLVEHGAVLTGAGGIAGEWGHGELLVDSPVAPGSVPVFPCGCGLSGCLDTIGSARGLERLHDFLHGARATSIEITAAWAAGEPRAGATIDYYARLVAGPLATFLNAFPASIVPVGGGLANCADLVELLDTRVRASLLSRPAHPVVVPATLGDRAGLLGAALSAA